MSLTKKQKCDIRQLKMNYASNEVSSKETEFTIPQFGEIYNQMRQLIHDQGFSRIKRCSPLKANCIIRVYQAVQIQHEHEHVDVYGAICYTKIHGRWKTNNGIADYRLEYGVPSLNQLIPPFDCSLFSKSYADYYIKIG